MYAKTTERGHPLRVVYDFPKGKKERGRYELYYLWTPFLKGRKKDLFPKRKLVEMRSLGGKTVILVTYNSRLGIP